MNTGRIFLIIVSWLICFIVLPVLYSRSPDPLHPSGPDAFTRLERVDKLVDTGSWYDGHIDRGAGDEGADIHWTRPLDILILTMAAPLLPFMETHAAIEKAGVVMPPLMSLVLVILCIWAVRPLMREDNLLMIVILLAVQPAVQSYFGIGRVDHHAVLAVLAAAVLGSLIRLIYPGALRRPALLAGMLSGLGIWISQEFLIIYAPVVAGLGACWLFWGAPWRKANRDFAIGCLALCVIGVAVDVPVHDWLAPRYDRISIAQLFLVSCPLVFWLMVGGIEEKLIRPAVRIMLAGGFAVLSLLAIRAIYPDLFVGPLAEADPRIGPIWYDNVSEMEPLWRSAKRVVVYCLLPFSVVVYGILILTGRIASEQRQMWLWLVLTLLGTGALAIAHVRAGLYLSVVAVIASAPLFEDLLSWTHAKFTGWKRNVTGLSVRTLVVLGPALIALAIAGMTNLAKPKEAKAAIPKDELRCNVREIAAHLSDRNFIRGRGILRFVNNIDFGPELIYRTPHHFLSVPYHRNGESILDGHNLMTATDFKKSRELLDKYHINYILICLKASGGVYFKGPKKADTLYKRLVRGDVPEGLTSVDAPAPWKLFKYGERDQ